VPSGGGDLDAALGERLAPHVTEAGAIVFGWVRRGVGRFEFFDSEEVGDHLGQRICFEGV